MQKFSLKNIRFLIGEFEKRLADLRSFSDFTSKAEESVKECANAVLNALIKEKLEGVFLGRLDLEPETLLSLTERKVTNASHLMGVSESVLANAFAVPAADAKKIVEYVGEHYENARKSVNVKLNVDEKTRESSDLVRALYVYRHGLPLAQKCQELLKENEARVIENINALRPYTSSFRFVASLLFNREAKARFNSLNEIYESDFWHRSASLLSELQALITADPSFAWEAFSQSPIPFFTDLERICPYALGNEEIVSSELPKEILDERTNLDGLKTQLRQYQVLGVKFILHQGRVLLGDEMGLGKTVEAIAALVTLKNLGETHFMVICPASILVNWIREIQKLCDIPAVKIHGPDKFIYFDAWKKNGGVAVTTYETSRQLELSEKDSISMVVVDEAHYIKNPGSQRTVSVRKICNHTNRLLLMTGTALENRTKEMLFLLQILRPKIASMAMGFAKESTSQEFMQMIAPIYYRRKREDVLKELPELIEEESWIEGGDAEMAAYEEAAVKEEFMTMRRVSFNVDDFEQSGKLKRIKEIVRQAKFENRKVLVFSFFLETIKKVCAYLNESCMEPITGAMPVSHRQEIIDAFEKSPAGTVLPLQINAGGLGLNIQAANVVILCEPQLKPSAEMQAISRAYRMGQVRNVLVYRLLMLDSIDEKINTLLKFKKQVFNTFADKSLSGTQDLEISPDEIKNLFKKEVERIRAAQGSVPTDKSLIAENEWLGKETNEEINEFGYREHDPVLITPDFMRKTCERYNKLYFEGMLDVDRLTFELDYSSSYLACFVPNYLSIVFSRHFEFDYRKYRNTMVHEMCHYYLYSFSGENGSDNTFKYETVHGKAFQDLVDRLNSKHAELNVMLRDCDC